MADFFRIKKSLKSMFDKVLNRSIIQAGSVKRSRKGKWQKKEANQCAGSLMDGFQNSVKGTWKDTCELFKYAKS